MKIHIDSSSADEAIIVMERLFDAPRAVVWAAFTDPKHVVKWYGGHGFTNPVCEMDVRPGGLWRHVMRTPDGQEYSLEFVFVDVVAPEKISWQNVDHGKRKGGPPSCLNLVTFEEAGTRTKWKLVARFNSVAERDFAKGMGFAEMVGQGSEKLNDIVKGLL